MSTTDDEFVLVGDHPENLASGAMIGPGERVARADLDLEGADRWLVDEGRLRPLSDFTPTAEELAEHEAGPVLSGKALDKRAADLEIEGRSSMSADELRAAIAEREAATIPNGGE